MQLSGRLWGNRAKLSYLLMASVVILFTMLGGREIWTQEHRWADIVSGMFYRHDFLHPYLGNNTYYDKPLLSYWLIALIAKISGGLTAWSLRVPSALAGVLAVWSVYSLGTTLKNKQLGFLSAWLLLTTFYFVFWARTSSADMLNLAGSVFAVAWYMRKRDQAKFTDYFIFFLIIAISSLCKGLVGAIVPCIAVLVDMLLQKSWQKHLRLPLFLSLIPALAIYLLPFVASSLVGDSTYSENGLYLVYRENILRYFHPFDHQGPIYTYFIYLPIYMLPWTIFFVPALFSLKARWSSMSTNQKWMVWTTAALFVFFTLSGSRRSYYVLPIVPFAILLTADWMSDSFSQKWQTISARTITFFLAALFLIFGVGQAWYYSQFGINRFAEEVKQQAQQMMPWQDWRVVMLDAESKLNFYLQLPPDTNSFDMQGERASLSSARLAKMWPIVQHKPEHTIFITRKLYANALQPFFTDYQRVELSTASTWSFLVANDNDTPIAFMPKLLMKS